MEKLYHLKLKGLGFGNKKCAVHKFQYNHAIFTFGNGVVVCDLYVYRWCGWCVIYTQTPVGLVRGLYLSAGLASA